LTKAVEYSARGAGRLFDIIEKKLLNAAKSIEKRRIKRCR
jgi:hypothetical protein